MHNNHYIYVSLTLTCKIDILQHSCFSQRRFPLARTILAGLQKRFFFALRRTGEGFFWYPVNRKKIKNAMRYEICQAGWPRLRKGGRLSDWSLTPNTPLPDPDGLFCNPVTKYIYLVYILGMGRVKVCTYPSMAWFGGHTIEQNYRYAWTWPSLLSCTWGCESKSTVHVQTLDRRGGMLFNGTFGRVPHLSTLLIGWYRYPETNVIDTNHDYIQKKKKKKDQRGGTKHNPKSQIYVGNIELPFYGELEPRTHPDNRRLGSFLYPV